MVRIRNKLTSAVFAHPFGRTSMNAPVFNDTGTLAAWAGHG
jgi:hypothetical protein